MTKVMSDAAYVTWLFRMALAEEHHPKFRNRYLRRAMNIELQCEGK